MLARALFLLGLLILALCWDPVAVGSALSPAAGSTGPATLAHAPSTDASAPRLPQELERGSDLFGKRRIPRGSDCTPVPLPTLPPTHHEALPLPAALAFEHHHHGLPGDSATPPRDHRRLLTERYPPQAPPLA